MADEHTANGSESSGDELEALLLAELEDQEPERLPLAVEEPPAAKRQKTNGGRGGVCPPHPGFIGGICIRCGELKPAQEQGTLDVSEDSSLAMKYIHPGLEVSRDEAARLRSATISQAINSRRLLLILDLDHTLLHSTRFSDLTQEQDAALRARAAAQTGPPESHLLHRINYMSMWTKLRPGIQEFLTGAHEFYDLHVFTMGDKDYAAGMARLLDPQGRLFGGKVASSSDAGPNGVKDIDVLLGAEKLVMILDDTVGVWPKHRANLMQIERYIYFPACAVRFGRGGQSLYERQEDESPDKGALATSFRVLKEVHHRFFERYDASESTLGSLEGTPNAAQAEEEAMSHVPDARRLLQEIRSEILKGCCVLFTRIISKSIEDPQKHPLWVMAVHLGAECVTEQSDAVTHIVAGDHTDKTKWGQKTGRYVVTSDWLLCCGYTWERASEERFQLPPFGKAEPPIDSNSNAALASGTGDEAADMAAALAAAGGGVKAT